MPFNGSRLLISQHPETMSDLSGTPESGARSVMLPPLHWKDESDRPFTVDKSGSRPPQLSKRIFVPCKGDRSSGSPLICLARQTRCLNSDSARIGDRSPSLSPTIFSSTTLPSSTIGGLESI